MGHFKKKPVVVEAFQWFKNGDHPEDYTSNEKDFADRTIAYRKEHNWEGGIVRYYRDPSMFRSNGACEYCDSPLQVHGWIDTLEGGHIVCPGDWIIRGIKGEFYPCKPDIFEQTYEEVDTDITTFEI